MPLPTDMYSNTTLTKIFYTAYSWPDDQELDILTRNYPVPSGKRLHITARPFRLPHASKALSRTFCH